MTRHASVWSPSPQGTNAFPRTGRIASFEASAVILSEP
jgi:hypothetical protein